MSRSNETDAQREARQKCDRERKQRRRQEETVEQGNARRSKHAIKERARVKELRRGEGHERFKTYKRANKQKLRKARDPRALEEDKRRARKGMHAFRDYGSGRTSTPERKVDNSSKSEINSHVRVLYQGSGVAA